MLNISQIVKGVWETAEKLQNGKQITTDEQVSLLRELKEYTISLHILKNKEEIDERAVAVLYLVKTLLDDLWRNLAGDATFGFQEVMEEAGEFSKRLGSFICLAMDKPKNYEKALNELFACINIYYSCLLHMRKKSDQIFEIKR